MRFNRKLILFGCLSAAFSGVPLLAQADAIVSMKLTAVAGPSMGGVYTSPYEALIGPAGLTSSSQFTSSNSSAMSIICDDFLTDVSVGQIWQATVTNLGSLSGLSAPLGTLKFDTAASASQQQRDYMAAAWLAEQIVDVDQSTSAGRQQAGQLSYAIWGIFDPGISGALSHLSGANLTGAQQYISDAYNAVAGSDPHDFRNVNIYTPDPLNASQEYLTVTRVPEPATLPLLAFGLVAIGFAASRRIRTAA